MQSPPKITYLNMTPSNAIDDHVNRRLEELEKYHPRIVGCDVVIAAPQKLKRNARDFEVRLTIRVPGPDIYVAQHVGRSGAVEDVNLAIHKAFDSARRTLKEQKREMSRREVKHHPPVTHGRIERLFAGEGYGYAVTDDGREVYFERDSLVSGDWDKLKIDGTIRFREMAGEKGPYAANISVAD